MTNETKALTVQQTALANPKDFELAFETYQKIQGIIDQRLKDHIMTIKGKKFRKKQYWRAVTTAFNLTVKPLFPDDFFETKDGDWGYRSTYVAVSPIGREAVGDGTCMASEKIVYEKDEDGARTETANTQATKENATHHNVRGHANTRAFNRAVSNLVGFGEVSAEEMPHQRATGQSQPQAAKPAGPWTGEAAVTFGKFKGTRWSAVPNDYLVWIMENMKPPAQDFAKMETSRRLVPENQNQDIVDAEPITAEQVELFP
jgi:hypothetical protein